MIIQMHGLMRISLRFPIFHKDKVAWYSCVRIQEKESCDTIEENSDEAVLFSGNKSLSENNWTFDTSLSSECYQIHLFFVQFQQF